MYSNDRKRFTIPLVWLRTDDVLQDLLRMAEDEFGLLDDGLPFDAVIMEEVVALLRRRGSRNLEEALLTSRGEGKGGLVGS